MRAQLSKETGISESTIRQAYNAKEVRNRLVIKLGTEVEILARFIRNTAGL